MSDRIISSDPEIQSALDRYYSIYDSAPSCYQTTLKCRRDFAISCLMDDDLSLLLIAIHHTYIDSIIDDHDYVASDEMLEEFCSLSDSLLIHHDFSMVDPGRFSSERQRLIALDNV